jgi:TrmH family RNA methyltransferase
MSRRLAILCDMEAIRSAANPALKRVRAVAAGREHGVLLLEGERLVRDALEARLALELVLVAHDRRELCDELRDRGVEVRLVEAELLAPASRLTTPPGIIALAPEPPLRRIEDLDAEARALVVVVAGVQDPGNLGALARTAEAAGASGLVVLAGGASPWNPKALRGSMGSLLRLPLVRGGTAGEVARALTARGFRQVRAATRSGADPARFDWRGPLALWLSAETGELAREAAPLASITIPMAHGVESLNVAAAGAVLLFAAGRTRA